MTEARPVETVGYLSVSALRREMVAFHSAVCLLGLTPEGAADEREAAHLAVEETAYDLAQAVLHQKPLVPPVDTPTVSAVREVLYRTLSPKAEISAEGYWSASLAVAALLSVRPAPSEEQTGDPDV